MSDNGPQVNGPTNPSGKYIDSIDPEDPEYIREMRRPADVKEDVQQMENRQRVHVMLNSQAFREELEQIIEEQIRSGAHPASLIALQQITDLLLPHSKSGFGGTGRGVGSTAPINDMRGVDSLNYNKTEKNLRCKLAALYRLVDMNGWSHGIYNHITARINQEQEHFLINPFGMLYGEVTASALIKVNMQGEVVDGGSTTLGINKAGFTIHSAIHQARPDIRCIVHLHTPAAIAVSAMKCGLLPISQEALICGKISYYDYSGIVTDQDERDKLARALGPSSKVLLMRNHGLAACGQSVAEAYHYAFNVMSACTTQMQAITAGIDNLILLPEEVQEKTFEVASKGGGGVDTTGRKWKTGEMEFEAIMRNMDNAGYRTGYVYRAPLIKQEKKDRANSEVEIPPTSSSFTYYMDGDIEHSKYRSPLKAAMDRQKQQYKVGWLNTPNVYKKTEVDETGTDKPKKITKWVSDTSPTGPSGTHVRVEEPNLFAPQGENPKEFRNKQKLIKKDYYEERVSAGPQSKFLDGITLDEAEKLQDEKVTSATDSRIVYGAASKGIIQRDQQLNVKAYKSYYSPNPFQNVSEGEIEEYKHQVETVKIGDSTEEDLSPGPDGHLISTSERMIQIQGRSESDVPPSEGQQLSKEGPHETNLDDGEVNGDVFVDSAVVAFQPRRVPSRETNIDDVNTLSPAPVHSVEAKKRRSKDTLIDDVSYHAKPTAVPRQRTASPPRELHDEKTVQRSESARYPQRSKELVEELKQRNVSRSHSDRRTKPDAAGDKPGSPTKSTDSASGGDTLEDTEGSPTKEHAVKSPEKEKKKKKKFRVLSFSKNKKKEKEIKQ